MPEYGEVFSSLNQAVIISLILLVIIAMIAVPYGQRLRLSFAAVLVLVGFIGSTITGLFGFNIEFQHIYTPLVIKDFILPVIVFAAAYRIQINNFKLYWLPILLLSLPILMLSAAVASLLLYWGFGHPLNFPISTALIAAALLAATDPFDLLTHLKNNHLSKQTTTLIEGENLFNDAVAVLLTVVLMAMALSIQSSEPATMNHVAWQMLGLLWMLVGGIGAGLLLSLIAVFLSVIINNNIFQTLLLPLVAYIAYIFVENYLQASGLIALLVLGLLMNLGHQEIMKDTERKLMAHGWDVLALGVRSLIFLLMGISLRLSMLYDNLGPMLLAIAVVIICRAVTVYGLLSNQFLTFKLLTARQTIDTRCKNVLFLGGTHGVVTVALALILPSEIIGYQTVQSMAFAVVLFALFIQAPLTPILLEKYLIKQTPSQINLVKNHRRKNTL